MARILGSGIRRVNSFHHQAVRRVAPGFKVAARATDGIIEAIEYSGPAFVLGVQWHPETMWERDGTALDLFKALVKVAVNFSGGA